MTEVIENTVENNRTGGAALPIATQFLLELSPISDELAQLPAALMDLLPYRTKTAEAVAKHIFSAGGKRVRPALFLLCSRLTGYNGPNLLKVAAISEYVHTASLLHDDVVDESSLRRGRPTANAIWDNQSSVLVGDLVYATACELMAKTGHVELVQIFAEAIRKMSDGELLQMENAFNYDCTVESYLEVLEGKTGVLIGASCAAAAIVSKLDRSVTEALYNFGNCLGIAFQLIDDALDYKATDKSFGKPTVNDITEGKLTFPVLKVKELATAEELKELKHCIETKNVSEEKRLWVSGIVDKYKTTDDTIKMATEYTNKAIESLRSAFPQSEHRDRIERIAKLLIQRQS